MKQIQLTSIQWIPVTFLAFGWIVMITGQSIVLYSRLHLISQNQRLLRFVFYVIIIDSVVLCIPTVVLTYGSNSSRRQTASFIAGYAIMEKIQMTAFTLQEFFISAVYLLEIRRILKVLFVTDTATRKLMYQLIAMNVLIVLLDVAMLAVEYINLYQIETTLKGMVYSVKLKVEFGVLSKIVKVVTDQQDGRMIAMVSLEDQNDSLGARGSAENRHLERLPSVASAQTVSQSSKDTEKHRAGNFTPAKCFDDRTNSVDSSAVSEHQHQHQQNLLPEWRKASRGQSISTQPTLLEVPEQLKRRSSASSSDSSDLGTLYPGRLG
jgi:hypothetical protein